jgi:hypothetical protein
MFTTLANPRPIFVLLVLSGPILLAPPAGADTGGPDEFRYTWADQDEVSCTYSFHDIRSTGDLLVTGDDVGEWLTLEGPAFDLYGETVEMVKVSTNGYVTTDTNAEDPNDDCPLPDPLPPNGTIYALHSDFTQSSVYQQYFADCPVPGRFDEPAGCTIIQWKAGVGPGPPDTEHVQAVLFDSYDLTIQINASVHDGSYAATGIENAQGTIALTPVCDTPGMISPGTAFCFFHPAPVPSIVFTDDFESGQTDRWTATVN